jgi:hypothetical protein
VKLLKGLLIWAVILTVAYFIYQIPGVNDQRPQPVPTRRSDPNYEPPEEPCTNFFYC